MRPPAKNSRAPSTARVRELIQKQYLNGKTSSNQFLPGERELAAQYSVARVTVRRALAELVEKGMVRAEPGRGYRALLRVAGLKPGSPAAYLVAGPRDQKGWTDTTQELAASMQSILMEGGWQALSIGVYGRSPGEILRALTDAGAWGAAIDTAEPELVKGLHRSGLPCLSMDRVIPEVPIDCIMQDNYRGCAQAADYLLEKGHRKIAWFGQVGGTDHSRERFTGAESAFLKRGLELPREYVVEAVSEPERAARELLSRTDRPTAVLGMWTGMSLTVARAAGELGLAVGKDLDLVAWATEKGYRNLVEREFGRGKAPPTVVWSTEEMARIAVTRLLWHVRDPKLKPLRISVPTRLIESAEDL